MSGGLTRVAPGPDDRVVSSQWGASSKDTWILASEPQKAAAEPWPQPAFGPRRAAVGALTAGAADQLFWMGRYAERAGLGSRLLLQLLRWCQARREGLSLPRGLGPALLGVLGQVTGRPVPGADPAAGPPPWPELRALLADPARPASLAGDLTALLRNIEGLRGLLPGAARPAAEGVGRILAELGREGVQEDQATGLLGELALPLAGLRDTCGQSMRRDAAWLFQDLGRGVEHALGGLGLARGVLRQPLETATRERLLESVLAASGGLDAHRRGFGERASAAPRLHSLLDDNHNPASVTFQFRRLEGHLGDLPPAETSGAREELAACLLEARAALPPGEALAGEDAGLEASLATAAAGLRRFAQRLEACYFSEGPPPQQLERLPMRETPA